jgi:hypothetical protein
MLRLAGNSKHIILLSFFVLDWVKVNISCRSSIECTAETVVHLLFVIADADEVAKWAEGTPGNRRHAVRLCVTNDGKTDASQTNQLSDTCTILFGFAKCNSVPVPLLPEIDIFF